MHGGDWSIDFVSVTSQLFGTVQRSIGIVNERKLIDNLIRASWLVKSDTGADC